MPPMPSTTNLRRKLLWSVAATLLLIFVTSTETLSNEHRPARAFSLGLEQALGSRLELGRLIRDSVPAAASPATTPPALSTLVVEAPGAFRLRPAGDSRAIEAYVSSLPFGRQIDDAARRHEIDVLLLASVVEAESSFRPDAISSKGALGLMQLLPLHFAEDQEPFDPAQNLELGARYLGSLRARYDGDVALALAAYHAGPGTIDRFGGAPPWRETRLYVDRVLALYREHQESVRESRAAS